LKGGIERARAHLARAKVRDIRGRAMMTKKQIEYSARSRVYLSKRTKEERRGIERRVLEAYDTDKGLTNEEEYKDYYLIIKSLKYNQMIRCGITSKEDASSIETFKTTELGKRHLKELESWDYKSFVHENEPAQDAHHVAKIAPVN
jgi:hypothetical protein